MAENETADIHASHRWLAVIRMIAAGCSREDTATKIWEATVKAWHAVGKQFQKAGFTIQQIAQAAVDGDRELLDRAYRETGHHRFVKLIESGGGFMKSAPEVLVRAMTTYHRHVEQQIRDQLVAKGISPSFPAASHLVSPAFAATQDAVQTLARGLIDTPSVRAAKLMRIFLPHDRPAATGPVPIADLLKISLGPIAPPPQQMGAGQ